MKSSLADRLFLLVILLLLVVGAVLLLDYGESWDNVLMLRVGRLNLEIYKHPFTPRTPHDYGPYDTRYFGPFLVTIAAFTADWLHRLAPALQTLDIFRYFYYLTFVLGVASLYSLSKRFMGVWPALGASLLFAGQPLLFGQAATNGKDIPFMGFFLAAVAAGVWLIDHLPPQTRTAQPGNFRAVWNEERPLAPENKVKRLKFWTWTGGIILGLPLLFFAQLKSWAFGLLEMVYNPGPETWLERVFSLVATSAVKTPLEYYQAKAVQLMQYGWLAGALLWLAVLILIFKQVYPRAAGTARLDILSALPFLGEFKPAFREDLAAALKDRRVWAAGAVLGLAMASRSLGIAAGGLVGAVWLLYSRDRKAVAPAVIYLLAAGLTTTLAWPFLWASPLARFVESFTLAATSYQDRILYHGNYYYHDQLPWDYLPRLMALQFTEPVVVLFLLGLGLALRSWRKQADHRKLDALLYLWLFAPILLIIVLKPSIHNNFRHVLFITPPIFIFCGLAMDWLFERVKPAWGKGLLVVAVVLPGLAAIVHNHPYEYVYYNQFIGGQQGAFRQYSMDYLGLSFKEAAGYLNENAEAGATILVWGPNEVAKKYLRDDLILLDYADDPDQAVTNDKTYWLILTLDNNGLENTREAVDLYQVKLGETVLAIVRKFEYNP